MSTEQEPLSHDEPPSAHPSLASGAYVEPLLRGRRVAVLGDATLPLASDLLERGARLVHVYDPDPGRVAVATARRASEASRAGRPVVAQLSDDLGVRDGAFDLVFVIDLSELDDPAEVVRRAKRMVSPTGAVVFSSPNPEAQRHLLPPPPTRSRALGYYELYDTISLQFSEVKMLGQAPFVGYALVDFSEAEPDVSIDTSALPDPESPEWYVVVASDRPLALEAYALVALPLVAVAGALSEGPATPRHVSAAHRQRDLEVALAEAQARISVLTTENEKLSHALAQAVREGRSFEHVSVRASELEREGDQLRRQAQALEQRLADEGSRAEALANDLRVVQGELAKERAAHEHALRFERMFNEARARVAELEASIAAMDPPTLRSKEMQQQRILALEAQRSELEGKLEDATKLAHARELARVEAERDRDLARRAHDEAKGKAVAARAELANKDAEVARLAAREAALTESLREAEEKLAAAHASRADGEKNEELEAEITRLEHALRDRGHDMLRVQRELREAERIGKELLEELARVASPLGGGGHAGGGVAGGGASGGGVNGSVAVQASAADTTAANVALAERAAKAEADVIALGWKTAQLERELRRLNAARTVHPAVDVDPKDAARRELLAALGTAQRELALARAGTVSADPAGALAEQAVLLEQVRAQAAAAPKARPRESAGDR